MTVEQTDIIDGIGIEPGGSTVAMLISDHLGWDDPNDLSVRAAKIEAYVGIILSRSLADHYPPAADKPVVIKLVYKQVPNDQGARFLASVAKQLQVTGIRFEHGRLMLDY